MKSFAFDTAKERNGYLSAVYGGL